MNIGNEREKYYTIGEVAEITQVKQNVLRFWESEFRELSPIKNKFGHRVYKKSDIQIVYTIKDLLYRKGLTIRGAKKKLEEGAGEAGLKSLEMESAIMKIKRELNEWLNILRSVR